MNREEKHESSRRRILESALRAFAEQGYHAAALNEIGARAGVSKGLIYHYFKDKDELYLSCVADCFDALTVYLSGVSAALGGPPEEWLRRYFEKRLRFFAAHPLFLGIFTGVILAPPEHLTAEIARRKRPFDELSAAMLEQLLKRRPLREGIDIAEVVEEFRWYTDFFNARFQVKYGGEQDLERILKTREEQCRRQVEILLFGVWRNENEQEA